MSDVATTIRQMLLDNGDIAAAVAERIYPDAPEQNAARPFIVYHEISGTSEANLEGPSGFAQDRLQIDCFADTRQAASDLRQLCRLTLQGYRGDPGGLFIHEIFIEGLSGEYEPPVDDSDQGRYVRRFDAIVSHAEAATL